MWGISKPFNACNAKRTQEDLTPDIVLVSLWFWKQLTRQGWGPLKDTPCQLQKPFKTREMLAGTENQYLPLRIKICENPFVIWTLYNSLKNVSLLCRTWNSHCRPFQRPLQQRPATTLVVVTATPCSRVKTHQQTRPVQTSFRKGSTASSTTTRNHKRQGS